MPSVLITNDDGVDAEGLAMCSRALDGFGDLVVVAPRLPQNSMGRSFPGSETIGSFVRRERERFGPNCKYAFGVDGSPAQAVSYAVIDLLDSLPDLCVCGINLGENVGSTITGSGTIGAALEAAAYGIPTLAVSVQYPSETSVPTPDCWREGQRMIRKFASILIDGMPTGVDIVNVNVPRSPIGTSFRMTVPSHQPYFNFVKRGPRDLSKPSALEVEILVDEDALEPNSDIKALMDSVTSVSLLRAHLGVDEHWDEVIGRAQ